MSIFDVETKQYQDTKGQYRKNIKQGTKVAIVRKKDQKTGNLTYGIVKDVLTKKRKHTRGIKVRLKNGAVGRVQQILN